MIIEVDSQIIVKALKRNTLDLLPFGLIIDDCKSYTKDIDQCHVSFVRRSANVAAHCLARAACSLSGQEVWVGTPPPLISDVLLSDLN